MKNDNTIPAWLTAPQIDKEASRAKKKNVVGQSSHTLGKHRLINSYAGKVAAVSALDGQEWLRPTLWLDLTAGDGEPAKHSGTSSPEILAKHHGYMLDAGRQSNLVIVEKDAATYEELVAQPYLQNLPNVTILNQDSTEPFDLPSHESAFVINDPNKVTEWALSDWLTESLHANTLIVSTLGCNVGGLKMLTREQRESWHKLVESQLGILLPRHDALLIAVDNDGPRWAYLVNTPKVWHSELEWLTEAAFPTPVCTAWQSTAIDRWKKITDYLFLTRKENGGMTTCQ